MNYFFLGTRIPPIKIGEPLDITFAELDTLMKDNLTDSDYRKTLVIRTYYDILNIRSFWLHEELDPYGNFNVNELEEALINQVGLPDYVYAFLDKYEKLEERLYHFPELLNDYFRIESEHASPFLKFYLNFEREWRLVLVGFRAKKLKRDLLQELQFEDPQDTTVQQILAQKDSPSYEPPPEFSDLKAIFDEHQNSPLELHLALNQYRFAKIEQYVGFDLFSIDRILGYMVRLIIAEKWQQLDKQKGIEIVDRIMKDAQHE